ncbi:aldehyde ferredoxin oxidoreductase C-terminal domain-containing protein [Chloroflexota bacterium]
MIIQYYKLRGWDEDGKPNNKTLDRLGLSDFSMS